MAIELSGTGRARAHLDTTPTSQEGELPLLARRENSPKQDFARGALEPGNANGARLCEPQRAATSQVAAAHRAALRAREIPGEERGGVRRTAQTVIRWLPLIHSLSPLLRCGAREWVVVSRCALGRGAYLGSTPVAQTSESAGPACRRAGRGFLNPQSRPSGHALPTGKPATQPVWKPALRTRRPAGWWY